MGKVDFSFVLSVARQWLHPSATYPTNRSPGCKKTLNTKLGWFSIFWGVAPHEKDTRHLGDQVVHIMKNYHLLKKHLSLNTKPFRVFSGKHVLVPGFNPLLVKCYWKQKNRVGFSMFWMIFPQTQGQQMSHVHRHAPPYSAYGFYGGHGIRCLWGQGCGIPPVTIWHDTFSSTSRPKLSICVTVTWWPHPRYISVLYSELWKIGSCMNVYICFICIAFKKCLDIILICTCISRPHKIAIAKFLSTLNVEPALHITSWWYTSHCFSS